MYHLILYITLIYAATLVLASFITIVVYAWDKRQAQKGGRRVSESRLHWLAAIGGWPGAWIAQRWLRHKTQKAGFQLRTWLITIGHLLLVSALIYGWVQAS